MQKEPSNKMMQSQAKREPCAACKGERVVKCADGTKRPCLACNGTGVAGGGYQTK